MLKPLKVEIIATNLVSGANALAGGADRIELTENMAEGGCTPSYGLIKQCKSAFPSLPMYVMIRPRGGDFVYSKAEIEQMYSDIEVCKQLGVEGIVFGILDRFGAINKAVCRELLDFWGSTRATFHRAIDRSSDMNVAVKRVVDLGYERVLTSGGKPTAMHGIEMIKQLHIEFGNDIIVMPGSGVTAENAHQIRMYCGVREIHSSCKKTRKSVVDDNGFGDVYTLADEDQVRRLCSAFRKAMC